ncbi:MULTISPECIES: response regulator transcription factor [Pseudomonas]|jgi:two-component system response regulator EvgA|uniref:response regulator transcription factor n=1 Tax=Pseudomonas TaxID=286 RepID=UPI000A1EB3C0|nr:MULTISPECIES: response regulator transcription factor [Pseudomonas]PNA04943.1 DNA-binding response regulator [Pseudomonas sp. FW305-BF15]PNB49376.1 DNA-binding response regulator [Pseudomonas sp. GW456-12-10-14-LB2]PNB79822.1 DNA-binding response regulator [Pseudomonas sp. FW305-BF6]TEA62972.1 response regulator transcription factor [Pseudomonas sp. CH235]
MGSALIVDDHPVVVSAVRLVLESLGYKPVYVTSDSSEVVSLVRLYEPDLMVLDLNLPGPGGLETLEHLKKVGLSCKVVVFSTANPDQFLMRCRRAGAMAFVTKSAELQQLQSAIKAVRAGYSYFLDLPNVTAGQTELHSDEGKLIASLSDRELQILIELARGISNKQIAEDMNRSHKTISTYKTRLMLKLGIKSSVVLREFAIRNHLL